MNEIDVGAWWFKYGTTGSDRVTLPVVGSRHELDEPIFQHVFVWINAVVISTTKSKTSVCHRYIYVCQWVFRLHLHLITNLYYLFSAFPSAGIGNYFAYLKNTASRKKNYGMTFFIDEVKRVTKHTAIFHRL